MQLGPIDTRQLLARPMRWVQALVWLVSTNVLRLRSLIPWPPSSIRQIVSQSLFGFQYSDTIDGQHIRLIRLPSCSTSSTSPPNFTIQTFPVSQCPPYIALSYTWGPPQPSHPPYTSRDRTPILLNSRPFLVYFNLFHALAQLCRSRPGEYLWVDSICINQAVPDERASQVAIMDLVYTGAAGTLIWLGPETERTVRAVKVLRQISKGAKEKILRWVADQTFGDVYLADDAQLLVKNGLPPLSADDWLDLADIFTRSWFGRVWMIQEVALATNPTVLIGPHELLWDDIGYSAHVIGLSNATAGLYAVGKGVQNLSLVIGLVHATGLQIMREWSHGEASYFFKVANRTDFAAGISSADATSLLLQLLISSNGFRATYRRDRVYALLGIANHLARSQGQPPLDFKVDYLSSDDEVLTTLGLSLFRKTQSLHLLSHAGLTSRGDGSNLATWMPSFENQSAPILGPNYTNLRPFNACNSSGENSELTPTFTIDEKLLKLHVRATRPHLGTIEEVGETWPEMLRGKFLNCIKLLLHCGDTYAYTSEPVVEAFWRTLIMDYDLVQRPAPSELAPSFAAWMKLITIGSLYNNRSSNPFFADLFDSLEPLWVLANSRDTTNLLSKTTDMYPLLCATGLLNDPDIAKISQSENHALLNDLGRQAAPYESMLRLTMLTKRRMARTVKGYLCLVPHEAEVGDRLTIVEGCPVPLVLRREKAFEDCFQVIGDAYVHGAMFGEHIKGDNVWMDISLV